MKLTNISNSKRVIYLYCRDEKGNLHIDKQLDFFPYFYEPDEQGKFKSVDGKTLKKIFVSEPSEIFHMRSEESYESDILFTRRYMLDKVKTLDKTIIKYAFIDIETLADELPNTDRALYPISCISVYNSMSKNIQTWYLGDYGINNEEKMIRDFINYMKIEKFDLWLSWNVDFDYNYVFNRCERQFKINFPKEISPIGRVRKQRNIFYPAGISIIDYLKWFKKIYMREMTYTLDYISEKYLRKGKTYKEVDFGKLNPDIKLRNIDDVAIMRDLEKEYALIPYYDEIRRLSKVAWEDLYFNSRVLEMLLLEESKKKNIVLPTKVRHEEGKSFKGATREALETGSFRNVGKYDLSAAYPSMIIDFCLDPANIVPMDYDPNYNSNNTFGTLPIYETVFTQNPDAILPTVVKKLLIIKNKLKKEKDSVNPESKEFKDVKVKYNAIKGIVNSAFGVFGNRFFRLYDQRITSAITYLVRDLLIYVKDNLQEKGYKVLYYDTDGIFIDSKENLVDLLNTFVHQWAKDKYNKTISIEFGYEGYYTKLFIVALCHYSGDLQTEKGIEKEVKGLEIKRKDSSKFMAKCQEELIEKCKNQESKENIVKFVKSEMERIKTVSLEEIALPCKLSRKIDDYMNTPIFVRALNTTQEIIKFKKRVGELYYYIYTLPSGSVMAFDKNKKDHIKDIDWNQVIRRNILMKAQTIFEALKWDIKEIIPIELLKPVSKIVAKRIIIDADPNQVKFSFGEEKVERGGGKSG